MTGFPADGMELTHLLVASDMGRSRTFEYEWEIRAFFRDPDGHRLEISETRAG